MSATASVMEPTNRSEIGSGRRRGRGRGRGRGQGVSRAGTAQNRPSQGWSINVPVEVPIVLQDEYSDNTIGERSRLFCMKAMERLGDQLRMKGLQSTRVGITILLVNDVLTQCLHWLQDYVRLHDVGNAPELSMSAMYQYLAMMFYSHCTGFSLNHTWTIMEKLNQHTPSLDVIRFISQNILAFSPSNRGNMGANSWSSQRDMTPNLTAFEKVSFSVSNSIFVVPNHTTATLDDDLYGTRASDNQVKTISNRKSDKEGHCADVIADALFRITLGIRFRRRGEFQVRNVDRQLNYILDACGEQSLNGFVMTADRGYGSMSLLKAMLSHGIRCIFIMPEHLKKCHPFVGKSFLNLDRDEEIEGEPSSSTGSDSGDDVDQESLLTVMISP
uniref:Uncharacterized protein n=1 Tax=Spongospora subterranea TaxID=70186 RepID=A0A0H5R1V3_9EUKA|eukprot:CRZ08213.1 hypothetical protein [Spongospora subterranea]